MYIIVDGLKLLFWSGLLHRCNVTMSGHQMFIGADANMAAAIGPGQLQVDWPRADAVPREVQMLQLPLQGLSVVYLSLSDPGSSSRVWASFPIPSYWRATLRR